MRDRYTPLEKWVGSRTEKRVAQRTLTRAEHDMKEWSLEHRRGHPLTSQQKDAIIEAYRVGRTLCCKSGRKTLEAFGLDACWVEYVSDWAYNCLGCSGYYAPGADHYEDGLQSLMEFLDRTDVLQDRELLKGDD